MFTSDQVVVSAQIANLPVGTEIAGVEWTSRYGTTAPLLGEIILVATYTAPPTAREELVRIVVTLDSGDRLTSSITFPVTVRPE